MGPLSEVLTFSNFSLPLVGLDHESSGLDSKNKEIDSKKSSYVQQKLLHNRHSCPV